MLRFLAAAMAAFFVSATPALAKDEAPCAAGMVCASNPATVAAALVKRGYQGLPGKDQTGDPQVESATDGYSYTIFFYGCEQAKQCDSLQFYASFKNPGGIDAAAVNDWNSRKRFSQMALEKNGAVVLRYDVATIGGLNATNFADVIDWWATMVGSIDDFFDEHKAPAAGAKKPAA